MEIKGSFKVTVKSDTTLSNPPYIRFSGEGSEKNIIPGAFLSTNMYMTTGYKEYPIDLIKNIFLSNKNNESENKWIFSAEDSYGKGIWGEAYSYISFPSWGNSNLIDSGSSFNIVTKCFYI